MPAESQAVPPKIAASPALAWFAGILLGATAVAVGAMVYCFNPATHAFYPTCLFHSLTGLNCPGCGMTRALYALLHGNVRVALKDNGLFVLLLVTTTVWLLRLALLKFQGRPVSVTLANRWLWTLLAVAIVFAVVRNLPGFEWLSP